MVNLRNIWILCSLFMCLPVISCVTPENGSVSRGRQMSVREQSEGAIEALEEISRLIESSDRKKILSRIEAAYLDIIKKYPDSLLVHECYTKLMLIYLTEYVPPEQKKAELLYDEFVKRYSDSDERHSVVDILGEIYYRNGEWRKLMQLYSPAIKRFIVKRELASPMAMLMYSEAKFHLGDMDEARKGYNIVIIYFPNSIESSMAKKRLDEIAGVQTESTVMGEYKSPSNGVDTIEAQTQNVPREAVLAESPVPGGDATINPPPMPNTNEQGIYSIQVGFFENEKNADALTEKLKKKGYDAFMQWHANENNKTFFRVFVGRYHDKTEAVEQAEEIRRGEGLESIGVGVLGAPVPEEPAPKKNAVPEQSPVPNTNEQSTYSVQVGFFGKEKNANVLSEKLKNKGYDAFVQRQMNEDKTFFRVLIGRYHDKTEAVEQAEIVLRREGLKSLVFQQEE